MEAKTKPDRTWIAVIIASIIASLCCITPFIAALAGIGGIASTFSWLASFRPYIIGITVLLLGFAWYQKLKPRTKEEIACDCDEQGKVIFWRSKTFLAIVTGISILLTTFPYYAQVFLDDPLQSEQAGKTNIETVKIDIKGMYCTGCAYAVNKAISKIEGIIEYNTSYEKGNTIVTFDKNKTSVDAIVTAINKTGYTVIRYEILKK